MFRFIGGPLDGRSFDYLEINAVAWIELVHSSRNVSRQFLQMPGLDACEKIIHDHLDKDAFSGPRYFYERQSLPNNQAEYRHVSDAEFSKAMESVNDPLGPEEQIQKQMLSELADRFKLQLSNQEVTDSVDVYLICRFETRGGHSIKSDRMEIGTNVKIKGAADSESASKSVRTMYKKGLIENVVSRVLGSQLGWFRAPTLPETEVKIVSYDLIVQS